MIQEPPSKTWLVLIVGIISASAVVCAAIIGLGLPFASKYADLYFQTVTPYSPSPEIATQIPALNESIPLTNEQPQVKQNQIISELVPIREHFEVSVGDGLFESGTFSDGLEPFSEDWLWTNDHHSVQRIRQEEFPDGCDISRYTTEVVWITATTEMQFTINDEVIGTYKATDDPHGYIFKWPIKIGDKLCAVNFKPIGYSIIIGPDIYYHYDSYCYRGECK